MGVPVVPHSAGGWYRGAAMSRWSAAATFRSTSPRTSTSSGPTRPAAHPRAVPTVAPAGSRCASAAAAAAASACVRDVPAAPWRPQVSMKSMKSVAALSLARTELAATESGRKVAKGTIWQQPPPVGLGCKYAPRISRPPPSPAGHANHWRPREQLQAARRAAAVGVVDARRAEGVPVRHCVGARRLLAAVRA
jgi:hypothetical protein